MCNKCDSAYLLRESACKILNSACIISPSAYNKYESDVMNIDLRVKQHRTISDPL